jgi:hypothetical protein
VLKYGKGGKRDKALCLEKFASFGFHDSHKVSYHSFAEVYQVVMYVYCMQSMYSYSYAHYFHWGVFLDPPSVRRCSIAHLWRCKDFESTVSQISTCGRNR